ncbi:MAG: DNA-binding response regulator [Bacteroidetes bacterium]|nr:MAG: DNA-binding response regulator [Bacteroidota bacterium]
MNVIIVDDEAMARSALRGLLTEYFKEVNILSECKNVPEAVRQIQTLKPDVVFLDVEMPEYNGFDLLTFFRPEQIDFQIIFITAYSEYALQAFATSAVDYILKPVRKEHIARALGKLKPIQADTQLAYQVLKENIQDTQHRKLVLHTSESMFVVRFSDIICLEADGNYTHVYTTSHATILVSKKLSDFDFLEKEPAFFRCHRSYLINTDKVLRVDKRELALELEGGKTVYVSQEKKKALFERLGAYTQ